MKWGAARMACAMGQLSTTVLDRQKRLPERLTPLSPQGVAAEGVSQAMPLDKSPVRNHSPVHVGGRWARGSAKKFPRPVSSEFSPTEGVTESSWEEEVIQFTRQLGRRMVQTWAEVKAEQAKAQAPFVPTVGKGVTCTGGNPCGG